jgi:hypothetical protein
VQTLEGQQRLVVAGQRAVMPRVRFFCAFATVIGASSRPFAS